VSHGTQSGYRSGCRCPECVGWRKKTTRIQREQRAAVRRSDLTDAAPIRAHVARQIARGHTLTAIAKAAKVKARTVTRLMSGESDTIRVSSAERLLAVDLPDAARAPKSTEKHPTCCALCEDLEWLLSNGETLPIVAMRLGMSEDTAAHHVRRYLPGLRVAS